jgi:hypothetical protein
MLPSNWQQAFVVLIFVIPGIIFQSVRTRLRGASPENKDASVRVLRAIGAAGILGLSYVAILGNRITQPFDRSQGDLLKSPRAAALWALLLLILVPAAAAFIQHVVLVYRRGYRGKDLLNNLFLYDPTPTGWDRAALGRPVCFVRVLTGKGTWVGGYAGGNSFVSAWPQERDIFVEIAYEMDSDGSFSSPVESSIGMWIRCDDAQLVQYLSVPDQPGSSDDSDEAASDMPQLAGDSRGTDDKERG